MRLETLEKDSYYHIYNRGINSENIFVNDNNKTYFLKLLSKYLNGKISVFAYCLMSNHYHLIVRIDKNEKEVTQSFSNFLNAYAKAFNKQHNRTGSLFEKHFKRIKLHDKYYLKALIIYVHLNPKSHLNIDYQSFKYSSYQSITSLKKTKIKRDEVLCLFDDVENFIYCHSKKNELLSEKFTFD